MWCVFDEASGAVWAAKVSTTPDNFADGVLAAIHAGQIDPAAVVAFVHGTTVVINAITQRRGVKTALVTTAGFRDVLEIGRGNRPDMYNLKFHKPKPFVPRRLRFEVRERVGADGSVWTPLATEDLEAIVDSCQAEGVEAIAICFLHAYAHPQHEEIAAAFLRARLPGVLVTASSEITREWREFERSSTSALNAYVQPILDGYLSDLENRLRAEGLTAPVFAMLSNGGTATFEAARKTPIALVESGPVAGVTGAVLIGRVIDDPNIIALDIGGTTAKCSLIENGEVKITTDYRLEASPRSSGYPVKVPVVDIVEIGAGGGSIAWFDGGGALRVGPVSAGADPGPACYGRGGTEADHHRRSVDRRHSRSELLPRRPPPSRRRSRPRSLRTDRAAAGGFYRRGCRGRDPGGGRADDRRPQAHLGPPRLRPAGLHAGRLRWWRTDTRRRPAR